jgi:starch phosphorylase
LDGANIEIRDRVGAENFFLFGLETHEVFALKANHYRPLDYYERYPELEAVIDRIASGGFSDGDPSLFRPIVDSLVLHDEYLLLADYPAYIACQDQLETVYQDADRWTRMAILNTARSGFFSSDRTIRQYCSDIWRAKPLHI